MYNMIYREKKELDRRKKGDKVAVSVKVGGGGRPNETTPRKDPSMQ
jgi:hypothetical protein